MADTGPENLIDRIVAGVLGQLNHRAAAEAPAVPPPARSVLEIADGVITAALLEERGVHAGPIAFAAKSVLTPSAREFLKRRKIDWIHANSQDRSSGGHAKWLVLVVRSTPATTAALRMAANDAGVEWLRDLLGCPAQATARAVGALCRGECDGAVVFSGRPEFVACRANRNPKIRAVAVATALRVKSLGVHIGPNLFAVDPTEQSAFELRNLLRAIGSGGKPVLPSDWNE